MAPAQELSLEPQATHGQPILPSRLLTLRANCHSAVPWPDPGGYRRLAKAEWLSPQAKEMPLERRRA